MMQNCVKSQEKVNLKFLTIASIYFYILGAYGKVYKGFLKKSGKFIAVKQLNLPSSEANA